MEKTDVQKYATVLKKWLTPRRRMIIGVTLLLVIGIVVYALDPAKKLSERRNSKRRADIMTIATAVQQYGVDRGADVLAIPEKTTEICAQEAASCDGMLDLEELLNDEEYLEEIPIDPRSTSFAGTGYFISKTASGRITVNAPNAELGVKIMITR